MCSRTESRAIERIQIKPDKSVTLHHIKTLLCYCNTIINDLSDESKTNITGMHDLLNQVLQELKETKQKLEDTKSRLKILEENK